jgi:hypothetical protein
MSYKKLGEAILLQAIKDAQAYTLDDFHRSDVWPFIKSKWFECICDGVEIHPDRIRILILDQTCQEMSENVRKCQKST